jgi:succinate dehydrogenase/fumarate reductase flavoprotein subunit
VGAEVTERSARGGNSDVASSTPARERERGSNVVVVGAGFGGITAAVAAQEDGARVLLVEKGSEPGGSFALSGGYVWTLSNYEDYVRFVPDGDRDLGRLLVDDFDTGIDWLLAHGARLGPVLHGLGPDAVGVGRRIEPEPVSGAMSALLEAFRSGGGILECAARVTALQRDANGGVCGVHYQTADAGVRLQPCDAVVLATGGFQGDAEMMARYVSPWSDRALLRASPLCTGDGIRLGLANGAATSHGLNAVYGHVMPAYPEHIEPAAFRQLTQFYVEECILLNLRGKRFVDESRSDAVCGLELLRQPEARGFIVFDAERHRSAVMRPFVPDALAQDPVQVIRSAGGLVLEEERLSELCRAMQKFAVPYGTALATVEQFDAASDGGDASLLPVPRARGIHPCRTPPFYAVPVRAGITFTEGGISVNGDCQALDRDRRPVPGLFVAGVDVGALSNVGYAGGLSAALITGLRAGIHAARSRTSARQ